MYLSIYSHLQTFQKLLECCNELNEPDEGEVLPVIQSFHSPSLMENRCDFNTLLITSSCFLLFPLITSFTSVSPPTASSIACNKLIFLCQTAEASPSSFCTAVPTSSSLRI
mmetsp:Transcript_20693/g.31126  ORF Transcript_20693/g.31126 Transcript_20693/m.31126 type:complete len:111 (-) Transcript_20693:446-778(-)